MTNELQPLPSALDAERALLGACLLEADAYERATALLTPEMFYMDWHGLLFEIMGSLGAIDLVTVITAVQKRKLDRPAPHDITQLTVEVLTGAHLEHHAYAIREAFIRRKIHRICSEALGAAFDPTADPMDLAGRVEHQLSELTTAQEGREPEASEDVAVKFLKRQMQLRDRPNALIGPGSDFQELDSHTLGWQQPDLILIAARPAVGKTAFALQLAKAAVIRYNTPAAVFTLEMSNEQLIARLLASEAGIPMGEIKAARLRDDQLQVIYEKGVQRLAGKGLYLDDTAGLSVSLLRAKLRKLKKKGVGLVIVDYLQLMKPPAHTLKGNRNDQVGAISRELKLTAKELQLPIIALSQLSRDVEKRGGAKPRMSDLRDAGGLEQDADAVFFLYGHREEDIKANPDLKGQVCLSAAKHRNGSLFDLTFQFDGMHQRFTCLGEGELPALPLSFRPISKPADSPF